MELFKQSSGKFGGGEGNDIWWGMEIECVDYHVYSLTDTRSKLGCGGAVGAQDGHTSCHTPIDFLAR
jgi:hypothetical protein